MNRRKQNTDSIPGMVKIATTMASAWLCTNMGLGPSLGTYPPARQEYNYTSNITYTVQVTLPSQSLPR